MCAKVCFVYGHKFVAIIEIKLKNSAVLCLILKLLKYRYKTTAKSAPKKAFVKLAKRRTGQSDCRGKADIGSLSVTLINISSAKTAGRRARVYPRPVGLYLFPSLPL